MSKVGIVTFHRAINYGAILQVYALQTILSQYHEVEIVDYQNIYFIDTYLNRLNVFKINGLKRKIKLIAKYIIKHKQMKDLILKTERLLDFIEKKLIMSKAYTREELIDIDANYDFFIAGSDQVWNMPLSNYDKSYLLDFASNGKRLSYAASFGGNDIDEKSREIMKKEMAKFKSLLVREESGKKILETYFGLESNVVVDPTLLFEGLFWKNFANSSKKVIDGKYLAVYLIAEQTHLWKAAEKYAKKHNLKIVSVGGTSKRLKIKKYFSSSVEDFVNIIANAECVFTTSFHGMIYSTNLNVPFYYELSKKPVNNNERLIDFSNRLGLNKLEIVADTVEDININWLDVNRKLDDLRKHSLKLLLESIK